MTSQHATPTWTNQHSAPSFWALHGRPQGPRAETCFPEAVRSGDCTRRVSTTKFALLLANRRGPESSFRVLFSPHPSPVHAQRYFDQGIDARADKLFLSEIRSAVHGVPSVTLAGLEHSSQVLLDGRAKSLSFDKVRRHRLGPVVGLARPIKTVALFWVEAQRANRI